MTSTPSDILSPHATGPRLLARLTAPLRRAGWTDNELWDESDEEDDEPGPRTTYREFSRSNFHISVSWDPTDAHLTVDDPTEHWDWDDSMPPLCPLDQPLTIDLRTHPTQSAKTEATRRAFAEAGLLDATRIHIPEPAQALRHDLVPLLWADTIHDAIARHRCNGDGTEAIKELGEEFSWRLGAGLRTYPLTF
ncbi:hypothetical protein AB0F92_27890 [Kitasatospora aureofaciens]|uniref:hypothetical protein n=1 Tax=Kitasatospora aureofaciens TaxID=1894 RepID=UPI0033C1FB27